MLLVFQIVFSVPIILWIESIGGGQAGGRWGEAGGGWEAEGRVKTTIWTQTALPCFQFGT